MPVFKAPPPHVGKRPAHLGAPPPPLEQPPRGGAASSTDPAPQLPLSMLVAKAKDPMPPPPARPPPKTGDMHHPPAGPVVPKKPPPEGLLTPEAQRERELTMLRIRQNTETMKNMFLSLKEIKTDLDLSQEWADKWWNEYSLPETRCPITGYMVRDLSHGTETSCGKTPARNSREFARKENAECMTLRDRMSREKERQLKK